MRLSQIWCLLGIIYFAYIGFMVVPQWDRIDFSLPGLIFWTILTYILVSWLLTSILLFAQQRFKPADQNNCRNFLFCVLFFLALFVTRGNLFSGSLFSYQRQFLDSQVATECQFGKVRDLQDLLPSMSDYQQNFRYGGGFYQLQKVEYTINGAKRYGCSCVSNISEEDSYGIQFRQKDYYGPHNFIEINYNSKNDTKYKFPTWSCYNKPQTQRQKCFVNGNISQFNTETPIEKLCLPKLRNAVIVFEPVKTTKRAVFILSFGVYCFILTLFFTCSCIGCFNRQRGGGEGNSIPFERACFNACQFCLPIEFMPDKMLDQASCCCYCPPRLCPYILKCFQ